MELLDLCPLETWIELEDAIYERSRFNPAIYDTQGIRIHRNHRWPNRLCPEIKAVPKGQSFICAVAHMNLANMARQNRQPVIEECDAGLLKLLVPIFVHDTYLGSAGGCGLIFEEGEVDTFLVNKIAGLDEDRVEKLAAEVPSITLQQGQALAEFIQERVDRIVADFLAHENRGSGR